ncbi:hypothetical protein B0J12DRAFT_22481 [Macrophomina phaseolina]|uniref:Uncharacterized protein n=1 Tax=Macrophomina phaseolina TaxID=35725 RepID=A0ABQ8GVI3_9PEZI|nr:hypothetical protein B0J12DRAFT_22481 [Macrophomina phaseolina]
MASTEPERRHWTETDACFFPAKQRDRGTWWMEGGRIGESKATRWPSGLKQETIWWAQPAGQDRQRRTSAGRRDRRYPVAALAGGGPWLAHTARTGLHRSKCCHCPGGWIRLGRRLKKGSSNGAPGSNTSVSASIVRKLGMARSLRESSSWEWAGQPCLWQWISWLIAGSSLGDL